MPTLELLLRGVQVVDGTGAAGFQGSVGIVGRTIALVSRDPECDLPADRVLEGGGLAVAPGFIDLHAHSDLALLTDRQHLAKVAQGVTFELLGQDGLSYAPSDPVTAPQLRDRLIGWNGEVPRDLPAFGTVASYLDRLDDGAAVNAGYLVPQGNIRMLVMGWRQGRPTGDELTRMCSLVAQGMEEGAFGLSTGLTYTPGMYADTDELVALCRVVASYGGFLATHQRSYGAGAMDAYREMVDIARRSGVALHLSHATMNFAVNRGRAGELLALVDDALADGLDVTLDSYPYTAGSTSLVSLLPSWVFADGPKALLGRLRDPNQRVRILRELDVEGSDGHHGVAADWSAIQVSGVRRDANAGWVGRTVAEIAAGGMPAEAYLDMLLADDAGSSCLMHVGDEDNVRAIMRHPSHTAGSDGLLVGARPHPRGWGTFARYLGHYARDEGVLTLEDCVAHLTSRPANRLGLADRGLVAEGYVADLVLFDPATLADTATYVDPRRTPRGIPYVLIGGEFVIDEGARTDALPGRALRRSTGRPRAGHHEKERREPGPC
jgi:N-acyl-D-amino-acid deacylase